MENINIKKHQNNYFRAEISKKEEKIFTLKERKKADSLLIIGKI